VNIDEPEPTLQPSMTERAIDTATDVSRTIEDLTAGLKIAVDRLRLAIESAERPGQPLARLRAATRGAPLTSLFIAFLFGVALTRRR
jgi:hypothetical protein